MIILSHVSKKLQNTIILDDLNLTLQDGRIYGLRGKNGAGKTMILRALSGLIRTSGSITIDGQQLGVDFDFPPSLGLLIENNNLLNEYTGQKNLRLLAKIKKVASTDMVDLALRRVGLDPNDKRKVAKYSLGMKQRLAIAQAIFEQPRLILLDEPTNAIDTDGVQQIKQVLNEEKARGATIVIASHIAEDLDYLADEIFIVQEGRVHADS